MAQNNFILNLIAGLQKVRSNQQIKTDIKSLGDIYIKLIGNLDISKTIKNVKNKLKGFNNISFNITPTVNSKGVQTATIQTIKSARKIANNNKITYSFDVDKQKLKDQLKNFATENSKLFSSKEMTAKYNQILDLSNVAKSKSELNALRKQLSAFKAELIATGKSGMTWADKFKASISHFAQYFSGASFIYTLTSQIRNAGTEAKTLDDKLVDLQKVTSEIADRDALYKYFDKAMNKAQELNVKVGSLINAITEFKKLGWSLSDAELGAEWSNVLANVGDVDIETAIGSIKTSIASFEKIGGYGNDQLSKKLEAYTDLINNMSNKYSIDAEGLAESIRLSAGTLTEAHTSIEQAATMFATANKYYNDPSYLGNTAKIGSLRMRASTGDTSALDELEDMGEEIDDLTTATSKLRDKLLDLTGVDIMKDGDKNTFKSYYDQLYEISQVIDKLDDTSRANVLETMFGKARAAGGAALLSGMKESATAYQDAINSAGSATEEYSTWLQSADAATQRFSNNLTKTYQNFINGNTVRDIANFGSAVLELGNSFGLIEGTLKGFLALKIGTFLTNGTMALLTATKQVEQFGKALQIASNIPDGNLSQKFSTLKSIAQATESLSTAQLKQVLSSQALSQQDRMRILQMQGMTKEMALQKLAQMNLTQTTNAQTAANVAQTASTVSLKAAMIGLGATIKSVFLSNPLGIALMAISISISAVTSAISKHNQKIEELRQKTKEAASAFDETSKNIENLKTQLDDCRKSLNDLQKQADNGTISVADEEQLQILKQTNDELERKLRIQQEEQLINAKEAVSNADKSLGIYQQSKYKIDEMSDGHQYEFVTSSEELQIAIDEYNRLSKEIDNLNSKYDNGKISYEKYNKELDNLNQQQLNAEKRAKEMYDILNDGKITYDDFIKLGGELSNTSRENYESAENGIRIYDEFINTINGVNEAFNELDTTEKAKTLKEKYAQKTISLPNGNGSYTVDDKEISNWIDTLPDEDLKVLATINFSGEQTKDSMQEALDYAKTHADTDINTSLTFKADFESLNDSLKTLTDNAELLSSINKEISETGRISADNLAKINEAFPEDKFPEMTKALYDYQLGLISTTELFDELEKCYDADAENYKKLVTKKLESDEEFFNKLKENYPEFFNSLADNVYTKDYGNWKTLEQAKVDLDNKIIEIMKSNWSSYISAVKDDMTGLYNLAVRNPYSTQSSDLRSLKDDTAIAEQFFESNPGATEEEYQKYLNSLIDNVNKINETIDTLNNSSLDLIETNLGDLSWGSLGGLDDAKDSAKDTTEEMNWLERAIKKVERAYNRLKNIASDTTRSWATRNAAVSESMGELTRQINLQSQAYEYYMQLFNALDLDDYYKQLIMDGAMFVETITDPDLLELINKAIELFDKAQDAKDSISSMTAELHELSTQFFDNTAKEFEQKLNVYEHAMKTLENGQSLIEAKGYKMTASLYEAMIGNYEAQISMMQEERSALEEAMNSADVEYGSEAWMDMYNQILNVDNAIQDATVSIAELNNELRQLKWDKFNDIQNGIQEIIDEADFLYELLESNNLTDDYGLNDNGIAAQGLLAEKYNLYMAMADKYAEEVKNIDAQLASDPNNVNLLERRQELLKAQREAILNANDEKKAISDLIEESYSKLGDTLSDLISKYKDFMKTIRDSYNYEKQMAEKTKTLADLQKQFMAVQGDNSEEGTTRKQKLEEQIKTTQDDIEQTQYEKLISDTEALLDKFNSEYEEWLTNLVVELETTLEMAIEQTNQYSDQILSTLNDQAYNVGYTLSDTTTAVFSSIGDAVSVYGQGFLDSANGITSAIGLVTSYVERIYNAVEAQAIAQQAIAQAQSQIAAIASGGGSRYEGSSSSGTPSSSGSSDSSGGLGVGSYVTLKDGHKYWETSWGNGEYGSKYAGVQGGVIIDEMSVAGEVDGGENDPNSYGDYYVHIKSADGQYRDLGWVRWDDLEEYSTGVKRSNKDLAWTQDGGGEIIRTKDGAVLTPVKGATVFSTDMTNTMWDFAKNPKNFLDSIGIDTVPNVTSNSRNSTVSMSTGDFNVTVVANNPQEFASQMKNVMANDRNAQKMIQEITLGQALGNNTLNVNKYR